jgi:tripartite-type tricarboxylate transporter receptor subunit TctC
MKAELVLPVLVWLAGTLVCWPDAARAEPNEYFKGKIITVYVSNPAGGGYDYYARLVARHIGRHLPGNPRVIVSNMPGAQGMTGANYLYNTAPRDGTALGALNEELAQDQVLGTSGIRYDASRFGWIGRTMPLTTIAYVWHSVPVKTIDDLRARETIFASSNRIVDIYAQLLRAIAGARIKLVRGYPGTRDAHLAMQRGEVEGAFSSIDTLQVMYADWLRDHLVEVLVQNAVQRHPDMPDVPAVVELAKTPDDRDVAAFFAASGVVGRPLLAPPDVPPDVLASLRAGFDATLKDSDFLDEARQGNAVIDPLPGAELQRTVESIINIRPELRDRAVRIAGESD